MMANVYTKTGDSGQTGLFGGSRVAKQSGQVEAYGTVDEANAAIGVVKPMLVDEQLRAATQHIQKRLFVLAAELASDAAGRAVLDSQISAADVNDLEHLIDECLAETGPQREFVVPGREPVSAALHQARTVVRRAERRVLTLSETDAVRPEVIKYLNRLSDALYAVARVLEERFTRNQIKQQVLAVLASRNPSERAGITLDLVYAQHLADAAAAKASEIAVPVVVAIVDAGGNLMLLHRMDDALLGSLDIAIGKAYTSAALRLPTHELTALAADGGELARIEQSNPGKIVIFGGGYPILSEGRVIGGLGVSGGSVAEDMLIATTALRS